MSWYFGTSIKHAAKDSDEPTQVCILNTALTAINFVSHDSNHNLEKGPFVYKFV